MFSGQQNRIMQEVNIEKLPNTLCPLFRDKPYAFCGMGKNSGICTVGEAYHSVLFVMNLGQHLTPARVSRFHQLFAFPSVLG